MYSIKLKGSSAIDDIMVFQVELEDNDAKIRILKKGKWIDYITFLFKQAMEHERLEHELRYGPLAATGQDYDIPHIT